MTEATAIDVNDEILTILRTEAGAEHLATRTAERIAAKGFFLQGAEKARGHTSGFNWGRSSHARTAKTLWTIHFTDATGEPEYAVLAVGTTTTYTRCNPYDRIPKGDGVASWSIQATTETMDALGWPRGEGR